MQTSKELIYNLAKLYFGDPRTRIAKGLLFSGIAILSTPWWLPFIQAMAVKYLPIDLGLLTVLSEPLTITGWSILAIGLVVYFLPQHAFDSIMDSIGKSRIRWVEIVSLVKCEAKGPHQDWISMSFYRQLVDPMTLVARVQIEIEGKFVNQSMQNAIIQLGAIEFWGVGGCELSSSSTNYQILDPVTKIWEAGDSSRVVDVPPKGILHIRFTISLGEPAPAIDLLDSYYSERVAVLNAKIVEGRDLRFRICNHSFWGDNGVLWKAGCKFPVYNISALNTHGFRAGRKAQQELKDRSNP